MVNIEKLKEIFDKIPFKFNPEVLDTCDDLKKALLFDSILESSFIEGFRSAELHYGLDKDTTPVQN